MTTRNIKTQYKAAGIALKSMTAPVDDVLGYNAGIILCHSDLYLTKEQQSAFIATLLAGCRRGLVRRSLLTHKIQNASTAMAIYSEACAFAIQEIMDGIAHRQGEQRSPRWEATYSAQIRRLHNNHELNVLTDTAKDVIRIANDSYTRNLHPHGTHSTRLAFARAHRHFNMVLAREDGAGIDPHDLIFDHTFH